METLPWNDTIYIVHRYLPIKGGFELCELLQSILGEHISVLVQVEEKGMIHTMVQRKDEPFDIAELIKKIQYDMQIEHIWTTDMKEKPPCVGRICKLYQLYKGEFAKTEYD
jgi:hypothetical protein